eukprot:scaffold68532_cov70-Phaeocystis_antarctica.AAC.15
MTWSSARATASAPAVSSAPWSGCGARSAAAAKKLVDICATAKHGGRQHTRSPPSKPTRRATSLFPAHDVEERAHSAVSSRAAATFAGNVFPRVRAPPTVLRHDSGADRPVRDSL